MKRWGLEVVVSEHGEPVQATVATYVDGECVGLVTHATEPFISWVETMQSLMDGLPVQQRLL